MNNISQKMKIKSKKNHKKMVVLVSIVSARFHYVWQNKENLNYFCILSGYSVYRPERVSLLTGHVKVSRYLNNMNS